MREKQIKWASPCLAQGDIHKWRPLCQLLIENAFKTCLHHFRARTVILSKSTAKCWPTLQMLCHFRVFFRVLFLSSWNCEQTWKRCGSDISVSFSPLEFNSMTSLSIFARQFGRAKKNFIFNCVANVSAKTDGC